MATLQNPNSHQHQIQSPISDRSPIPAQSPKTPSFEEVSSLFSLPLSDAADSIGVCPSVLKTVCYENGLVRWPYRKFLSGKSIEEIKRDAAIQKEKQLAESKVSGERDEQDSLASLAVSSSSSLPQPQRANAVSLHRNPASRMIMQKANQIQSSYNVHSPTMNQGNSATRDEFKYGFPSEGLLTVSYRWWGNKCAIDNYNDSQQSASKDSHETKPHNIEETVTSSANFIPSLDKESTSSRKNEQVADTRWAGLLCSLTKKVARDGRQALKLGVYRGYSMKTLDHAKRMVLIQIFQSSLPSEWGDISLEV